MMHLILNILCLYFKNSSLVDGFLAHRSNKTLSKNR